MKPYRAVVPALALAFALPLAAQDRVAPHAGTGPAPPEARMDAQPSIRAFWAGLGVAFGTPGIGVQIDATLRNDDRVMRARFLALDGDRDADGQLLSATELAGMYGVGRRLGRMRNWYSAAAGVALLTGHRNDEEFTTMGIPLELQAVSRRVPHLGAALTANLNPKMPYVAATMSLQLGRAP